MLKQLTITLDTNDPLQAQLLVEYLAASDRTRFGRTCMMLGYLAATGVIPAQVPGGMTAAVVADGAVAAAGTEGAGAAGPAGAAPPGRRQGRVIGAKLFGVD